MKEYGYRGPSIDHSILSPSGRCSKRARDAAMKRESAKLFPPGFWDKPTPTEAEQAKSKADGLRLAAKTLRDLAARGMNRHRYTYEAAKLEAQADSLIANIMICVKTHSKKDGSGDSDVVQFIADENSCCCTCRHSDQTASGIVCNTTRKKHFECINSKNLVNWERGTCRKIAVYVDDGKVMKGGGKWVR